MVRCKEYAEAESGHKRAVQTPQIFIFSPRVLLLQLLAQARQLSLWLGLVKQLFKNTKQSTAKLHISIKKGNGVTWSSPL